MSRSLCVYLYIVLGGDLKRKVVEKKGKSQGMGALRFCERASGWAAVADSSDYGNVSVHTRFA